MMLADSDDDLPGSNAGDKNPEENVELEEQQGHLWTAIFSSSNINQNGWDLLRYHKIYSDLTRSTQSSQDLLRSHKVYWDLTRSTEISQDLPRSHKIFYQWLKDLHLMELVFVCLGILYLLIFVFLCVIPSCILSVLVIMGAPSSPVWRWDGNALASPHQMELQVSLTFVQLWHNLSVFFPVLQL